MQPATNTPLRLFWQRTTATAPSYNLAAKLAALLLSVLLLGSCHNPDEYVLSSAEGLATQQLFTLSVEGDSTLPADGFSSAVLRARLRDVSQGSRTILFAASAGSLRVGTTIHGDSAAVLTDLNGEATVELVSARQVATARVEAVVEGTDPPLLQVRSLRFAAVASQDVIAFVELPDSILANGLEVVPLTVQISPRLQGQDRQVTFRATQGSFAFATDDSISNDQIRLVEADTDGRATAYLRSPAIEGQGQISATVKGFTQEATVHFIRPATDDMIRFIDPPTTAPADGSTAIAITVRIANSLTGRDDRTVEFATTHGDFVLTDGAQTVSILADANGQATVHLRSPDSGARAQVRATVKDYTQETPIDFTAVPTDSILVFVDPPATAPADGSTVVDVTVRIAASLTGRDDRTVEFATTHGSFALADGAQRISVLADADGRATAHLRSPDAGAQALITATAKDYTQEAAIEFTAVPTDGILRFVETAATAPADGNTLSRYTVEILPGLEGAANRTVEFETTHGSFVLTGNTGQRTQVQADANHRATAYLQSPLQLATALVTARLKGVLQEQTVRFEWAPPDTIFLTLDPDKLKLEADDQMFIEAALIRTDGKGTVTQGMEVAFAAADTLGEPIERVKFANITRTNSQGTASAFLNADDTPYRGPVTLTAKPAKLSTDVVGSASLEIVDP